MLTQAVDIRNKDAVEALYARIEADFGTVDVLVNNAGSGKSVLPIKDLDPDDFWYDFVSRYSLTSPQALSMPNTVISCNRKSTSKVPSS